MTRWPEECSNMGHEGFWMLCAERMWMITHTSSVRILHALTHFSVCFGVFGSACHREGGAIRTWVLHSISPAGGKVSMKIVCIRSNNAQVQRGRGPTCQFWFNVTSTCLANGAEVSKPRTHEQQGQRTHTERNTAIAYTQTHAGPGESVPSSSFLPGEVCPVMVHGTEKLALLLLLPIKGRRREYSTHH